MTVGQFLESVIGKEGCIMGHFSDGTPFTEVDVESIGDILEENVIMKDMEMKSIWWYFRRQMDVKLFTVPHIISD